MKRSTTVTRLYSLGDYKNISFTDTIEDIPEEVALNNEAMQMLRAIQLFQIERAFLKYQRLRETTHRMNLEESLELINELDVASSKKFDKIFTDAPLDETSPEGHKGETANENA